ncbi:1,4-alpha-glucan branching enzyme [Blautia sp. Sow4_E7]|uniref:1,4-alpha-glucan branching enzyme n=1 Tax=Blautia sp. Sow4_E7 TaxID=3438749 RepID=UPI003F910345
MSKTVYDYMDWPGIEAVVYGEETAPRDVMGPRLTPDGVLIQGFFPEARSAVVAVGRKKYEMELEDEAGYYAVLIPGRKIPDYEFQVELEKETKKFKDAYAFGGLLTEEDERAFLGGVYYEAYKKMGAHPMTMDGVAGTHFAVWAPNAIRVSVVGEFNNWDGRVLPMHKMPMSGIFELFVPGVKPGAAYRYEIKAKGDVILQKADPYGNRTQPAPVWNSVVAEVAGFQWTDGKWMADRKKYDDRKQPVSIYETSLGQWKEGKELIAFAKEQGYTHVELHPVMEFLEEDSDGYPTSAYFAVSTRYGTLAEFAALVDGLHREEIGVILDWSPAQFPRYAGGLEKFDGTPLYEVKEPNMAVHPMWGTMLYNYDSPMVKDFLISNACFWLEVFHVDGLRMDDVDAMLYLDYGRKDGWTPNLYGSNENLHAIEFLKHLNSIVKKRDPGALLIAQEDGLWPELTDSVENDHIGFDYKWSGGWTRDFLFYLSVDPILRKNYHDQLTLSTLYAYSEHYILTFGSRDVGSLEAFMAKLPGDEKQKLAQVKAAYSYMMVHPGCKMMAPGAEMPEGLSKCIQALNAIYKSSPALYQMDDEYDGFEWIQLMKYEENVITFLRKTEKPEETLLVICNFAAVPHENYQVGVPFAGKYKEIFNSDAAEFGGEGVVNARAKSAKAEEFDEREHSIKVKLPALGVSIFSCTPGKTPAKKKVTAAKAVKTTKDKNAGKLVKAARTKVAKKVEAATEKAAKKTEIVEKKAATNKPVKEEKSAKAEEAVKAEKKEKAIK